MKFEYINSRGDTLSLINNNYFTLTEINGQTLANINLSSTTLGGFDGDVINNAQAQPRPVILTLRIKDNVNVEEAKRYILRTVKLNQIGTVKWSQNDSTKTISGLVESVNMARWQQGVAMLISLHCSQPFWEDINYVIQEINEALGLHYFTATEGDMLYFPTSGIALGEYDFSRTRHIYNASDVAVGIEITIQAFKTVTNPIIYDANGNYFGIGYGNTPTKKVTLQQGDKITINTTKGKKSVLKNGSTNLLNKLKSNSTWLQLEAGDNAFTINSDDAETDNMTFWLQYKQRYI